MTFRALSSIGDITRMSAFDDSDAAMPALHTAADLGLSIRLRRKALGWDQAMLARQIGVTRQWVIDIEKGKPRAELELALRALRVLGLSLTVETKPTGLTPSAPVSDQPSTQAPGVDINAIVRSNRLPLPAQHSRLEIAEDLLAAAGNSRRGTSLHVAEKRSEYRPDDTAINRLRALLAAAQETKALDMAEPTRTGSERRSTAKTINPSESNAKSPSSSGRRIAKQSLPLKPTVKRKAKRQ